MKKRKHNINARISNAIWPLASMAMSSDSAPIGNLYGSFHDSGYLLRIAFIKNIVMAGIRENHNQKGY
jgi:hypothetical protein